MSPSAPAPRVAIVILQWRRADETAACLRSVAALDYANYTVLVVDIVKGVTTPWPRIESDTHVMSTGSARPLEDAFRISHLDLIHWFGAYPMQFPVGGK